MAHDPNMNDEFELAFPLWSLQMPKMLGQGDDRLSFVTLTRVASGEVFWPIFTNLLMAEQFLTITEMTQYRPFKLRNFDDVYVVGNYWTERGIRYVGLNISLVQLDNGQFQDTTTLTDLQAFMAEVRAWERESIAESKLDQA